VRQAVCLAVLFALPALAWGPDPQTMHVPTPEELALKNVPFEPGAPAAFLEWEHYQDDTNGYAKEYARGRMLAFPTARRGTCSASCRSRKSGCGSSRTRRFIRTSSATRESRSR